MIDLKKFPKIELHVHLDGSVNLELASKLLKQDIELIKRDMVAPNKCHDLNDYLTKFSLPVSMMQTKENLEFISEKLGEDLINDGVIYAEIRFAPIKHITKLSLDEVMESVLKGLKKVPIKTNLILCLMRDSSFEDNKKIINLAKKYLNKGVCAIDLAGAEGIYKTSEFEELFKIAYDLNIPFTIHAGEADGESSIDSAINFGTTRIGHGIRCIENIDIVNKIKDKGITLEVCPTSNVQTNAIDSYQEHPIKFLFDNDVNVTINTDNRTVSNITLTEEYEKLIKTFNFSLEDIKKMNINAINSSFLNQDEKKKLLDEYLKIIN